MKFTTYNIIYLISNFFTIFIIHRFMKLFFSKNNTTKFVANIAYLSYFIVTSLAYLLVDIPIITLALNWIIVFCISLTYESTMQKRMMYSTYIIVFMLFPELIVGAATGYLHFSFFRYWKLNFLLPRRRRQPQAIREQSQPARPRMFSCP